MKRLMFYTGLATAFAACSGKDDNPPLIVPIATGGSTTGGRSLTGGSHTATLSGAGGSLGGATLLTASGAGGILGAGGSLGGAAPYTGGASTSGSTLVDAGGDAGEHGNLAPIVKITSPATPTVTPNDPGVIVDSSFEVLCTVTKSPEPGSADIDTASIAIIALDSQGKAISGQPSIKATATGNPNEYKATFTFSSAIVAAGRITFVCSASDKSAQIRDASATLATFVDFGPNITYVLPSKDLSAYPKNAQVPFEFQVDPTLLDSTDTSAQVSQVALQVLTQSIPLSKNDKGHYVATVDFSDRTKFAEGLTGTFAASVSAKNSRVPKPAVSTAPINIVVDGTPPTITFDESITPAEYSIIGHTPRKLCFNVADGAGAGVNQNTITVKLDDAAYTYLQPLASLWSNTSTGNYCFQFNGSDFGDAVGQVTVTVLATDYAGNVEFQSRRYYLDNYPPFVSLDPPNIRVIVHSGSEMHCSAPFDPVGGKSASYGDVLTTSGALFRAFVWDRTDHPEGWTWYWYSSVDPSQVNLYLRPWVDESTPPVIVDADKDPLNLCDTLDPALKTNPSVLKTQLSALPVPNGSATYLPTDDFKAAPDVSSIGCTAFDKTPDPLCAQKTSDMTFVPTVTYGLTSSVSAVYGVGPDSTTGPMCTGNQWAIGSAGGLPDGWVCVVAEAVDYAGNVGISAPIPICLANNVAAPPACASHPGNPPNCSLGCKPPSRSISGDYDGANYVDYDIGKPLPWAIEYR